MAKTAVGSKEVLHWYSQHLATCSIFGKEVGRLTFGQFCMSAAPFNCLVGWLPDCTIFTSPGRMDLGFIPALLTAGSSFVLLSCSTLLGFCFKQCL